MIEDDGVSLVIALKGIQDALDEGGHLYKSCLMFHKFNIYIDKKIRECEGYLASISQSYAPKSVPATNFEPQVLSILNKIKSLNQENDIILGRGGEVRSLITPQIDSLMCSMQDAKDDLNKSVPTNSQGLEMHAYLFSGMISILESLKKEWDNHLLPLRIIFADIFKFL